MAHRGFIRGSKVLLGAGLGMGVSVQGFAQSPDCSMTWELLKNQNSNTSNEVIKCMSNSNAFATLSKLEGDLMVKRDEEDEQKLWKGVEISISRGVLQKIPPPVVTKIDVVGKTPNMVADFIISKLDTSKGCVVVLQGMSGTGKGTTGTTLLSKLPNCVTWSNGNVFRSLTLLAATHAKQEGIDLKDNAEKVLTSENVAKWMKMLSFHKTGDKKYDIKIQGLGLDVNVSEVQNTLLKETLVAKNIPTVAEQTQGDVVKFAAAALKQMTDDGMNVILEGRAATVQYVPTPYRFELIIKDSNLLGQRRAAQRVMAGCEMQLASKATSEEIMSLADSLCKKWTQ